MSNILCIDPGTPFGFAVWDQRASVASADELRAGLLAFGHRFQPGCKKWRDRSAAAARDLYGLIKKHEPVFVFMEEPIFMSGHAAADRGDLVKLCRTHGRFEQICDECLVPVVPVAVADWLGQLKAHQVRHRAEGILGKEFCDNYATNEHALDAICIGLHVLGRWPS
jgi:hypothetical protein